MTKLWFNHWFSTVYNMIEMLKEANKDYYIIGTNDKENAVYKVLCDEWYTEPILPEDDYVDYCLNFCQEHEVDVFIPRRHFLEISKNKVEFEKLEIKVMVDDYEKIEPLNYKTQAYEYLKGVQSLIIPEYYRVTNIRDFEKAYLELKTTYSQVCFKFEHDEGGKSFRLIDENRKGYSALFKKQNTRMTFEDAAAALSEKTEFSPLIVMPYLSGKEISVDCLATDTGRIMIPRIKGSTRVERITYQDDILKMCNDFLDFCPLECPFNIQFKYLDGVPYFLEVNTRMSGGIPLACAAENINILDIAVAKLLGITKEWSLSKEEKKITYIEKPLIIK